MPGSSLAYPVIAERIAGRKPVHEALIRCSVTAQFLRSQTKSPSLDPELLPDDPARGHYQSANISLMNRSKSSHPRIKEHAPESRSQSQIYANGL